MGVVHTSRRCSFPRRGAGSQTPARVRPGATCGITAANGPRGARTRSGLRWRWPGRYTAIRSLDEYLNCRITQVRQKFVRNPLQQLGQLECLRPVIATTGELSRIVQDTPISALHPSGHGLNVSGIVIAHGRRPPMIRSSTRSRDSLTTRYDTKCHLSLLF